MGTPVGPKYIPYTYMDPLGITVCTKRIAFIPAPNITTWSLSDDSYRVRILGAGVLPNHSA